MDEESVLAYLRAVGDELPIYRETGLAPPLYAVSFALGQILQRMGLPPGAIHSLQEFDTLQPVALGSNLRTLACLERQRERGGLRFLTFGINMENSEGRTALSIKTTLLVPPAQGEQPAPSRADSMQVPGDVRTPVAKGELCAVTRKISRPQLAEYSAVSGDHNPIHLDPEFAAGTQFGGIIAHGMLTLAFINEMMANSVGESWLASGSLRARFKGAAYPGDLLETWGKQTGAEGNFQKYNVGISNFATGEDLVTGTATVRKS
jgi:3-hydroxybutyryl-CoA dehydratase